MTRLLIAILILTPTIAGASSYLDLSAAAIGHPGFSHSVDDFMSLVREASARDNLLIASGALIVIGGPKGQAVVDTYVKAAVVSELIVGTLKYTFNRKRPEGIHSRMNSSFPSSHAATSFAVAASVSRAYPGLKIPLYTMASLVAFSRVYHTRHHLTDVVAGAAIGVAAARISEAYLSGFVLGPPGFRSQPGVRIDPEAGGISTLRVYLASTF